MVAPAAALEAGRAVPVPATLLEPAGTRGFRLKAKPVVVVEEEVVAVVVVVVVLVVEAPGAVPGALRLKPRVPALGVAAVVTGAERESTVALDEAGAAAMEAKSVDPALVVAAVGVAAAGCAAPAVVVTRVAGVNGEADSAVGWAELPMEPMLKPEAPGWDALPLVNENPVEPVDGAEVVEEPKTKPVGAVP